MIWPKKSTAPKLLVDMHSHILPGIDDGAVSMEYSIKMIEALRNAGFVKLITTPHIHPKYPNSEPAILRCLEDLRQELNAQNIKTEIEAAAEYFVDHQFIEKVDAGEPLLTFGGKHILVECSFTVKPFFFESVVYKLKEFGYKPVFAHPERYKFLEGDIGWLRNLKSTGISFQVTLGSIGGYYGKTSRRLGIELINNKMVDFLASDLHRVSQMEFLEKGLGYKAVQGLVRSGTLMNNTLI